MLRKTILAATAALGLGTLGLMSAGTSASAASMYAPGLNPGIASETSANIHKVRSNRYWRYDRQRYGDRYRYRHGSFRHYYGGYYYSRPWWNYGSGVSINLGSPYGYGGYYAPRPAYYAPRPVYRVAGGGHVQWCLDHYRSYNPNTDTFIGYDGYAHRCNSPY